MKTHKLVSEADIDDLINERGSPHQVEDGEIEAVSHGDLLHMFNSLESAPEVGVDSKGLPQGLIADLMVAADLVRNKQVAARLVNYANQLTSCRPEVGEAVDMDENTAKRFRTNGIMGR